MSQIFQAGSLNTTALTIPDLYIQIIPPQFLLNGVPSNVGGLVGAANWGPVGIPVICAGLTDGAANFGRLMNRKYDLLTGLSRAQQEGNAAVYYLVRASDGTDAAATIAVQTNCMTLTSKWTGSGGNETTATFSAGSAPNTKKCVIALPFKGVETFDNIYEAVHAVSVGTPGTGYTSAPSVTFSAPQAAGGRQAQGFATVGAGAVTAVTVTDPGWGYTSATLTFAGGGGTGAVATATVSYWASLVDRINNGSIPGTPKSAIVVATLGAGTTTPASATVTLTGGADGYAGVTGATLIGVDTVPRKGMYALRNTGTSVAALCDCDDSTTYPGQVTYGLSEGTYMILTTPSGDTVATAQSTRNTGGIDSYAAKLIVGDFEFWYDQINGLNRYISPQFASLGKLCNLAPHHSSLNKKLNATIGTQRTIAGAPYSLGELQVASTSGLDLLTNPIPAGNVFGFRFGRNSSSNPVIHGDNYTRMTNYLAATLAAGMGIYVGELQSRRKDDKLRARVSTTLNAFLATLAFNSGSDPMIDDFQVICDKSNNSDVRIALGYLQADVKVVYMAVVEYFIINLEGGQSVVVTKSATPPDTFLSLTNG